MQKEQAETEGRSSERGDWGRRVFNAASLGATRITKRGVGLKRKFLIIFHFLYIYYRTFPNRGGKWRGQGVVLSETMGRVGNAGPSTVAQET